MSGVLKPFSNLLNPGVFQKPTGAVTIDWNNAITRNLEFASVFDGPFGNDLVNSYGATPTNSPTTDLTTDGAGVNFPSGGTSHCQFNSTTSDLPYLGDITILYRGTMRAAAGTRILLTTKFDVVTGTHAPFEFRCDPQTAPLKLSLIRTTAVPGFVFSYSSVSTITFGPVTSWGVTQVAGAVAQFYFNGVGETGTLTAGTDTPPYTGANIPINVGGRTDGALSMNGVCLYCFIWSRALTATEMAWLAQNPYDFLVPAEYELPILIPGAGPTPPVIYAFDQVGAHITRKITSLGY